MEENQNKIVEINGVIMSERLIDKIRELQDNDNSGIKDIIEEVDDITCDLADMSLDDHDASYGKYFAIIQALRSYRRFFELILL